MAHDAHKQLSSQCPVVLLVYGEKRANAGLAGELELDGYVVHCASHPATLRERCTPGEVDLVIFGQSPHRGFDVLRALRAGEWDVFLSYARIDGEQAGDLLCRHLQDLGVRVWFDAFTIQAGKSQARQMDQGLQKARAGVVLLTPAFVAGRFWTERELGALLHKETLIPVLDGVTFEQVAEFSGILPDLAGFETARDSIDTIAQKIAAAVLPG